MGKKLDLPMNEITENYLSGMSTYKLAKKYGCTQPTILNRLNDNNVKIRSLSEAQIGINKGEKHNLYIKLPIDEICEKYLDGMSCSEIAKEYHCSIGTIYKRLCDNQIEIRSFSDSHLGIQVGKNNGCYIDLPIDEICEKFLSGISTYIIGKEYGCSRKVITRRLYDAGIDVVEEANKHHSATLQGISYSEWDGNLIEKKYCSLFNEVFKEKIRNFYNRRCFLCGKSEEDNGRKLPIHHVNYDKNCLCGLQCKFVSLCDSCHSKTNSNRQYWEDLIMNHLYPSRYFIIDI